MSVGFEKDRLRLDTIPALKPIAEAFLAWTLRDPDVVPEEAASAFVVVKPGDDVDALLGSTMLGARRELGSHLKLRFVKVETAGLTDDRTLIFLQDVTEIENQAQQLKLASMGRLTASIAHEVRNPLSAIGYASSLLAEDASDPGAIRLLKIVSDNVARLDRMIEDILKLSRKAQSREEPLALAPFFADVLAEFNGTHALSPGMIEVGDMGQYHVWFDPMHLREVVVNLLTNAIRYSSGQTASIRIYPVFDSINRLEVHVHDDGPAVTPEVRAHLFEPFYTTSSKGTGLGLYLARELCLNNGAMIDYEYRHDFLEGRPGPERPAGGRFVITFALAD